MTRFVGHGQPIIHVFETAIILNMVKSVKCQFFNPTGPDFVGLSHIYIYNIKKKYIYIYGSVKFSGITSPIRPPTLRNITSSNVER